MRIVFVGTGLMATPSFEALIKGKHDIVALVTDRERGEGTGPEVPAGAWRIPVFDPADPADPKMKAALRDLAPELLVLVGYRAALPPGLIRLAPRGAVKVHPSLLPRHRGPEPIAWAILDGDRETGVTALLMDEGVDTGPILLTRAIEIGPEETASELTLRLAGLAAEVIVEALGGLAGGRLTAKPQAQTKASHAGPLDARLGIADWSVPAIDLARRMRALSPAGVRTSFQGEAIHLLRATPMDGPSGEPGLVQSAGHDGIVVSCGQGTAVRVTQLQIEGRRPMSPSALITRLRIQRGTRFELG